METVSVRELRNRGGQVLQRVAEGETLTVTIDGRPIAELRPVASRAVTLAELTVGPLVAATEAERGVRRICNRPSPTSMPCHSMPRSHECFDASRRRCASQLASRPRDRTAR